MTSNEKKVISVIEMREADAYTIAKGTPGKELMLRAARGVYDSFEKGWKGKRTAVVCGSGNNGGDGYALAMIMEEKGLNVTVYMLSEKFSEDGGYYHEKCEEAGVRQIPYEPGKGQLKDHDILVDCILGTGFTGEPHGTAAEAIKEINRVREEKEDCCVISVDINSGMNGDTGEAVLAVKSDLTVSIGFYKYGFFGGRSAELIDSLTNVDIGIVLPEEDGK